MLIGSWGVGLLHSTKEASNDRGGKAATRKSSFLKDTLNSPEERCKMETQMERIAEIARKHGKVQTLVHHINADNLKAKHKQAIAKKSYRSRWSNKIHLRGKSRTKPFKSSR